MNHLFIRRRMLQSPPFHRRIIRDAYYNEMCKKSSIPLLKSLGSSATFSCEVFKQHGNLPTINYDKFMLHHTQTEFDSSNLHRTKIFSITEEGKRKKPLSLILPKSSNPTTQILAPGMILWKNYISLCDQVEIVNTCQEFGVGHLGFYKPSSSKGSKFRFRLMCFGRYWDPEAGYCQSGSLKFFQPIPDYMLSLVKNPIQDTQAYLNSEHEFSMRCPDSCIVKFYTKTGRRAFHKDVEVNKGSPLVSISIGDSAQFLYGQTKNVHKSDNVLLESGDVLIFGGKSRHIYHGVKRIIPNSAPLPLLEHTMLKPGRLNLNFTTF